VRKFLAFLKIKSKHITPFIRLQGVVSKKRPMQKLYHVEFTLPDPMPALFIQLIPEQRSMVKKMMEQRVLRSYALSLDRSRMWCIFAANSEFELLEEVSRLPLSQYLTPRICELMFHNSAEMTLSFSMN
jgi:muconolactone delta-isomerase